jgi:hypothetical protein
MRRLPAVSICSAALLATLTLAAEPARAPRLQVQSAPSADAARGDWRRRNERGDRFEGLNYGRPVGVDGSLELVDAHWLPLPENLPATGHLALRFFVPAGARPEVVVRERMPRVYYRMEPHPPAAGWRDKADNRFAWPISEVLKPARLRLGDLAFQVRLEVGGSPLEHYAVVGVAAGSAEQRQRVRVVLMPKRNFSASNYAIGGTCGPTSRRSPAVDLGPQYAGVPFPIDLPAPDTGQVLLTVSLAAPAFAGGQAEAWTRAYCLHTGPSPIAANGQKGGPR